MPHGNHERKQKMRMETTEPKRGSRAAFAIVAAAALLPSFADAYQFIISGDPVAASTADSRAVASTPIALESATATGESAASPLEARYRTWDESDGVALRSDKATGLQIFIR